MTSRQPREGPEHTPCAHMTSPAGLFPSFTTRNDTFLCLIWRSEIFRRINVWLIGEYRESLIQSDVVKVAIPASYNIKFLV